MLDVFGVQVVIKIHDGLEGSQVTVEEQQQQFELSVGGTARQTVLEDAKRLPHRVLVPCNTESAALEMLRGGGTRPEDDSPVSLHKSMYT